MFFLLRSCKVYPLCHVWNQSVSSLLCYNKKYVGFALFCSLFVSYIQEGCINEVATLSVARKLILKKSPGGSIIV